MVRVWDVVKFCILTSKATSTFDKRIVVSKAAAKRLSDMFKKPAMPLPNISEYLKQSETIWQRAKFDRR